VVVHARGALVSRRVDVPALPEGDVELLIPDVTVLADGGSVRATVGGGRSVTGVRTALHVPETPVAPGESVELVRALTGRIERLAAEKERLSTHRTRLDGLDVHPRLRYAARAPRRGADIASRTADALASAALIAEIVERLDARLLEIDDAVRDLERQLEAARLADAQAKSRARMGQGHPTRRITVQLAGSGRVEALELAYVVPAARWWPSYTLRMADDGRRATWTIEALVAQLTGEDWTGVALSLSTADLIHDARLPELASRRLGRAQPPPKRSYRPAPSGLEQMFAGYDRAFGAASRGLKVEAPAPARMTLRPEEADEPLDAMAAEEELTNPGDTRAAALGGAAVAKAPRAFALPAPGMAPAGVLTPVPPPAAQAARRMALRADAATPAKGAPVPPQAMQAIEPGDAWLDFDTLTMAGVSEARRGRLVHTAVANGRGREAENRIESLTPERMHDPLVTRGQFDHRHDAPGRADVPSDGQTHRVTLAIAEAAPSLRWRCVPREAPEVYKEAALGNPFAAPLLAGPVEVYVEGTLLASTAIERVDRGGRVTVGMGVEERIRVARNARVDESAGGLMRGATIVETTVTVDLVSSLGMPARVEIADRIPVTDDKGLEITLDTAGARPDPYTQAERGAPLRRGLLWTVDLAAGGKAQVVYRYVMTFPSKSELVGGNRRE